MNKSNVKLIKLVDFCNNSLNVTNDSKEVLAEYAFLCAKYAYVLRNIEMIYKTFGKKEIISKYLNNDYNAYTKFKYKFDIDNDIPISTNDILNFGIFLNLKGTGYIKAVVNPHLSLFNKTITNEFYHVGRIIALTLYILGGGINEIKEINKALCTAQSALWRITFKKNNNSISPNQSKKLNRIISKDFQSKYIIQLLVVEKPLLSVIILSTYTFKYNIQIFRN